MERTAAVAQREAELARREAELARREADLELEREGVAGTRQEHRAVARTHLGGMSATPSRVRARGLPLGAPAPPHGGPARLLAEPPPRCAHRLGLDDGRAGDRRFRRGDAPGARRAGAGGYAGPVDGQYSTAATTIPGANPMISMVVPLLGGPGRVPRSLFTSSVWERPSNRARRTQPDTGIGATGRAFRRRLSGGFYVRCGRSDLQPV